MQSAWIQSVCIQSVYIQSVSIQSVTKIHLIRWILIIIVILFFTFSVVKVTNSHVHLWTCTDAPWVAQRRSVCSSPALLAAPFFDGSNHCQCSWVAMSDVAWIHVSTWMQAFLECKKANESVGCLLWVSWWLPLVVPGSLFETCFRKVIIVKASLSDDFVRFGRTNILETLTYKVEQWWTVFCESEEVLGLKLCLFGHNVSGETQMAMLCTKHMAFQKNIRV